MTMQADCDLCLSINTKPLILPKSQDLFKLIYVNIRKQLPLFLSASFHSIYNCSEKLFSSQPADISMGMCDSNNDKC